VDVAAAVKAISAMTAKGALGGISASTTARTWQGETQHKLDVLATRFIIRSCEWAACSPAWFPRNWTPLPPVPVEYARGRYLLVFDPLDGSSNTDVNVSVGTIFSVLRHDETELPGVADYLQRGEQQVAAGYAIYGPATMLVISAGKGTHGFTLDREIGNFILTHPNLQIPADTAEFCHQHQQRPLLGAAGAPLRGPSARRESRAFAVEISTCAGSPRWSRRLHRILMRGGVFMYPRDSKDKSKPGRLRLLYEANPISLLVEQAGGRATTGNQRLMESEARVAASARLG